MMKTQAPADIAMGYLGGILAGAGKLSRVAWLQNDPAIAEVLGIEAVASQSTLSRFFGVFGFQSCEALAGLRGWALRGLPSSAAIMSLRPTSNLLVGAQGGKTVAAGQGVATREQKLTCRTRPGVQ
jgi:hypothetical protein